MVCKHNQPARSAQRLLCPPLARLAGDTSHWPTVGTFPKWVDTISLPASPTRGQAHLSGSRQYLPARLTCFAGQTRSSGTERWAFIRTGDTCRHGAGFSGQRHSTRTIHPMFVAHRGLPARPNLDRYRQSRCHLTPQRIRAPDSFRQDSRHGHIRALSISAWIDPQLVALPPPFGFGHKCSGWVHHRRSPIPSAPSRDASPAINAGAAGRHTWVTPSWASHPDTSGNDPFRSLRRKRRQPTQAASCVVAQIDRVVPPRPDAAPAWRPHQEDRATCHRRSDASRWAGFVAPPSALPVAARTTGRHPYHLRRASTAPARALNGRPSSRPPPPCWATHQFSRLGRAHANQGAWRQLGWRSINGVVSFCPVPHTRWKHARFVWRALAAPTRSGSERQ